MQILIFESFWRDVRYALRTMLRSPAFTATAVGTLALGIGANTAIFTAVHAVLLKPLAYRDSDRVVHITGGATPSRVEQIQAAHSFSDIGAFTGSIERMTLSSPEGPEALKGARVSANFLRVLGVEPLAGRAFLESDDRAGGPAVAMISAPLWRRRFGGDPQIVGKTVTLSTAPHTIVGVTPDGFRFPFAEADVWVPRPTEWTTVLISRQFSPVISIFGRLKPGVTPEQASAELEVINQRYALAHPAMLDA